MDEQLGSGIALGRGAPQHDRSAIMLHSHALTSRSVGHYSQDMVRAQMRSAQPRHTRQDMPEDFMKMVLWNLHQSNKAFIVICCSIDPVGSQNMLNLVPIIQMPVCRLLQWRG